MKALICIGGNPMAAWPDQRKTQAAMQALDLLVTLDVEMSSTARLADYVIACKPDAGDSGHESEWRSDQVFRHRDRVPQRLCAVLSRQWPTIRTARICWRSGISSTRWLITWSWILPLPWHSVFRGTRSLPMR